jgi:hypothetical protein
MWGVSLSGPTLIVDLATRAVAGNQSTPAAKVPNELPIANAAIEWGCARWTMLIWQLIPAQDQQAQVGLMLTNFGTASAPALRKPGPWARVQ